MRRSLGDALKNASKETTMKNVNQLTDFRASNEETESKIKIYVKN